MKVPLFLAATAACICMLKGVSLAVVPDPTGMTSIPPVVLQFCAPTATVQPRQNAVVANNSVVNQASPGVNSMDISFVNVSKKIAKIVVVKIGGTEIANIGKFSPDVAIKWRVPAVPGSCSLRAVRFEDGTEWTAPPEPHPSASAG